VQLRVGVWVGFCFPFGVGFGGHAQSGHRNAVFLLLGGSVGLFRALLGFGVLLRLFGGEWRVFQL
jgi:hypothetical protein